MSEDFRAEVEELIKAHSELNSLKKRKREIKQAIEKINNKHDEHVLVNYAYISQENVDKDALCFLQETFADCGYIISCTIFNGMIKEKWGWIIDGGNIYDFLSDEESSSDSADDNTTKDGEYYIFLDNEYHSYLLMYQNEEKINDVMNTLEDSYHPKVEYGEDPPCHADECWYKGNSDRLGEWCGSYRLPDIFGNTEIIQCGVCHGSDCLADEIYDYGENIKTAYKRHKKNYYDKKG